MAEWLGFYGPLKREGSVEDVVSHLPAVRAELKAQSSALMARARSNLSLHRDTGNSRVDAVAPPITKLDWHVALYDPKTTKPLGEAEAEDRAFGPQNKGVDATPNQNMSAIAIERRLHILGDAVEDRVRKHGNS